MSQRIVGVMEQEAGDALGGKRAPRGRGGATLVREAACRTARGAKVMVREWWHRERGRPAHRYVEVKRGTELLAEYTAVDRGNAAVVFEAFVWGVFDLSTRLADLPAGLSGAMGRALLKVGAGDRVNGGDGARNPAFVGGCATPAAAPPA